MPKLPDGQEELLELPPELEKLIQTLKKDFREALQGKDEAEIHFLCDRFKTSVTQLSQFFRTETQKGQCEKLLQALKLGQELSIDQVRILIVFFNKIKNKSLQQIAQEAGVKHSAQIYSFVTKHAYYAKKGELVRKLEEWLKVQSL